MSRSEQPVAPRLRPDNPAARAATRASQHGAGHQGGAHRPVRMHPRSYPHPHRRPLPGAQRCWRARARRARPPGGPPFPSDRGIAPPVRPRARPARPTAGPPPTRPPRPDRPARPVPTASPHPPPRGMVSNAWRGRVGQHFPPRCSVFAILVPVVSGSANRTKNTTVAFGVG